LMLLTSVRRENDVNNLEMKKFYSNTMFLLSMFVIEMAEQHNQQSF
jgi:hypothetical protein